MSRIYKVAIIGGGISGSVTALQLAKYGVDSVLFEQRSGLVSGPPFCHLHAGGNLYPEISLEQCKQLMQQSIESARLFPLSIDKRPTFIAVPQSERLDPQMIEDRLKHLVRFYKELVEKDPANEVLGPPDSYFSVYNTEDVAALGQRPAVPVPETHDHWLCNALKFVDYGKLKSPVFIVQEYGWNFFRLAAQTQLALERSEFCDLQLSTHIVDVKDVSDLGLGYNWQVFTKDSMYKADYLVNSSGFNSSVFDSCLQLKAERMVEFKASYTAKWQDIPGQIPEFVFHGERGSSHGMAQLTPYCGNYYQIHGMTNEITLFENGLVKSDKDGVYTEFDDSIKRKINGSWDSDEVNARTVKAIGYVAKFMPAFASASVGGPPLYGAQQIPGEDVSLRVGDVTFPRRFYARSEIVKASSAFSAANHIIINMQKMMVIPIFDLSAVENDLLQGVDKSDVDRVAAEIAAKRGYPSEMSQVMRP